MAWTNTEKRAIQRELSRLGLYLSTIDGIIGPKSEAGLVEAFGGDEWKTLSGADTTTRLRAASAPTGTKGERFPRYAEMFRGGALDITLGVGFDEVSSHHGVIEETRTALLNRGFGLDTSRSRVAQLYAAKGRTLESSAFGQFYVLNNAIRFTPPAGESRDVHIVVRLLYSLDGSDGPRAGSVFRQSLIESDIAVYTGHARYGSGPDFDRNMTFDLLDTAGNVERSIELYTDLEVFLADEGKPSGRSAWQQFLYRVSRQRIVVYGSNGGNAFLNPTNRHPGEFGGQLMYWNLLRKGGLGAPVLTGKTGELGRRATRKRYSLWLLDGCRTQDYLPPVRSTPGCDSMQTDMFVTQRVLYWNDNARTVTAFLDGVRTLSTAQSLKKAMDAQNQTQSTAPAIQMDGFTDNPVVP